MYACNNFFTSPNIWGQVRLEWRRPDVYTEQATNEHGRETRRLLTQLLHRGFLVDSDDHDDEQQDDEDGRGPDEEDEDRKHELPAPSATRRRMANFEARVRDEPSGRALAQ